jgi:hypothetical protein
VSPLARSNHGCKSCRNPASVSSRPSHHRAVFVARSSSSFASTCTARAFTSSIDKRRLENGRVDKGANSAVTVGSLLPDASRRRAAAAAIAAASDDAASSGSPPDASSAGCAG